MPAELWFTDAPVPHVITGPFGATTAPWTPTNPHRGTDFGCPEGTPVRWMSRNPAKVVPAVNDGSFGKAVNIDAIGTKWYVLFAHLSEMRVDLGAAVQYGDVIGLSGATGKVTGPHLHVQVCDSDTFPVDIANSTDYMKMIRADVPPAPAPDPNYAYVLNDAYQERMWLQRLAADPDDQVVRRAIQLLKANGFSA